MTESDPTSVALPPEPSQPPRQLTRAALRRSLMEPRVRFWWMAALFLAIAAGYFLVRGLYNWYEELDVVRNGTPVVGTITRVGEGEMQGRANFPPDTPVVVEFDYSGTHYSVFGPLDGNTKNVGLKQTVTIRIKPSDPETWTFRTDTPPLEPALISPILVAPFAAASALASLALRKRMLHTWKTGTASAFAVEEIGQSALAPGSWVLRCHFLDGRSPRLVQVFVPRKLMQAKPGDVLWLIHHPTKPTAAIAAMAYA